MPGKIAGDAKSADGADAHFERSEAEIAFVVHHGFSARDDGLELVGVQFRSLDSGTIDISFFREVNGRGGNVERLDHVKGNGIQQLQNVVRRQQLLTKAVEALQFAAAADGFLSLFSRAVGQLAGNYRGGKKCEQGNPVLRA